MSTVSSIASSVRLPKVDFSSKAGFQDSVTKLAQIAGDVFLKPSGDNKDIFQSEINFMGSRLPNPVNVLTEKTLGLSGEKVRAAGYSTDAIANAFAGSRNVKGVGETTLPAISNRIKDLSTTKASRSGNMQGVGGGSTAKAAPKAEVGGGSTAAAAPKAEVGGSSAPVASSGHDFAEEALNKFSGKLSSYEGEIEKFLNGSGELEPTALARIQAKMQKRNELFQMLSQLMQMEHETKKGIIQNIR